MWGVLLVAFGCQPTTPSPPADSQPVAAAAVPGPSTVSPIPETTAKSESVVDAKTEATAESKMPLGLPPLRIPVDNPMTAEKIELGKMLYFDKRVSKDGAVSCASCHDPKEGWTERKPTSEGINGQKGGRNSPSVLNAAYAAAQFWDGRAATLEEQATGPVENPIEMGNTMDAVVASFAKVPGYRERFQKVFGTDVTKDGFAKAIAAFERTVLSGNSPYDRFKAGDDQALTEVQKRGLDLFEGTGCADCHKPPLFSTYQYENAGVDADKEKPDVGRKAVTGEDEDLGRFRIPSLRNAADTAPYFHDGSAATLEEAVALMAAGGKANPNLSKELKALGDANLTEQDRKDLVEFLKALSGEIPVVEEPKLP
jgi:cytochrome c peroxidase